MQNKQNLHIHSTYADGKDRPEAMIEMAIQRGFDSIGFSEHSYMEFSDYPYQMTVAAMEDYKREIHALQAKYAEQIDIFCGLEYEMYSTVPTEGMDYIIGSVHYLDVNGQIVGFDRGLPETLAYIDKHFNGDGMAFSRKYFETISRLPEKGKFDIIGHFDLQTKNNEKAGFVDTHTQEYLQLGYDAIHNLKGQIPLFEVNTGAISRGYRTNPYPQIEFLREFCRCGFGAVITSDCHDRNFIDCYFEEAEALLKAAGFCSKWILTKEGFKEVGL